jgi:hypothetical protein
VSKRKEKIAPLADWEVGIARRHLVQAFLDQVANDAGSPLRGCGLEDVTVADGLSTAPAAPGRTRPTPASRNVRAGAKRPAHAGRPPVSCPADVC